MQLITNHDELHEYAAGKVVEGLRRGAAGDALLGSAAYILGAHAMMALLRMVIHVLRIAPVISSSHVNSSVHCAGHDARPI